MNRKKVVNHIARRLELHKAAADNDFTVHNIDIVKTKDLEEV